MNRFPGLIRSAVLDLQKIISDLKASGIGVLITDHNVRETLSVTDVRTHYDVDLAMGTRTMGSRPGSPTSYLERLFLGLIWEWINGGSQSRMTRHIQTTLAH